jgi:glycosyltransferase involved in cell wall biosynthesis
MISSVSLGGMRSVVEGYMRDGFMSRHDVKFIASYRNGNFTYRQLIFLNALSIYVWTIITRRVDLVHCHAAMRGSFWRKLIFAELARACGIPVLMQLHGSEMDLFFARQSRFVQRLIVHGLNQATRVLVLSDSWRSFVRSIAPNAKVIVIPNYVKCPPVTRAFANRTQIEVLFLGLIGQRKGVFDLLKAFQAARSREPRLHLTLAGNGQIEDARRATEDLQIADAVTIAGWADPSAKAHLLANSDVFVLPSYHEGLPVSILEALASRLAVISTDVGGIPEVITDGEHGRIVKPGAHAALAQAIIDLAGDPQLRQQLADAGFRRIRERYSDATVLPLLSDVYRQCSRGAPARSVAATSQSK